MAIVLSAEKCERYGSTFYKAPNWVILTPGLNGFAPASCILCGRQLPSYKAMWSTLAKIWGSAIAPALGLGYGEDGGRKRHRLSLTLPTERCDPSSDSGSPSPTMGGSGVSPNFDGETMYLVETVGRNERKGDANDMR